METIGVRALKARLSHHLKRVRAGHHLIVTDRGRAVASIQPVEQPADTAWIHKMVAEGKATWSGGKPQGIRRVAPKPGKSASDIVIEDRR